MTIRFVTVGDDLTLPADVVVPGDAQLPIGLTDDATGGGFAITDTDGRAILAADSKLELYGAHSTRSLNESMASSHIFKAMRYAAASNTTQAAYWYDRAEQEHRRPIRLDINLAWDDTDGTGRQRMPAVQKLYDGRLLAVWSQIKNAKNNDQEGARVVAAFVDYDLDTGSITKSAYTVLYQPPLYASQLGAGKHLALIKLPADAATHPGRTILTFNINDAADGTEANGIWNFYEMHTDDDGATWSTPAMIYAAPGVAVPRGAYPGTSGSLIRIPSGTNAGRLVQPMWNAIGTLYALISDDDGGTWTAGAPVSVTGGNEWSVAWRPDGTLIGNVRYEAVGNERYVTSADDGETWTYGGEKSDWPTTNCSRSTVQASTTPDEGYSKIIWSGLLSTFNTRRGLQLRVSHDGGLTYQHQYDPFVPSPSGQVGNKAGYSDIKMIGPDVFACVWEAGFNSGCSMNLYIANMAEVYARGTQH